MPNVIFGSRTAYSAAAFFPRITVIRNVPNIGPAPNTLFFLNPSTFRPIRFGWPVEAGINRGNFPLPRPENACNRESG
jgi:hypothetical protein